jgi:Domain of unknown function (DUF1707)
MASDADHEKVVDMLKAAFARGRLTKHELDLRVGQTFAARTYADLAALTADLPAGSTSTQPAPKPARADPAAGGQGSRVVRMGANHPRPSYGHFCGPTPTPTPTDNQPIGKILFLVTVVYFTAWLVVGAQMLGTWHQQRSRPGVGPDLMEPGSPAVSE